MPHLQQLRLENPIGLAVAASLLLGGLVAIAYLAKSAAGIDLLPGPSPLHDLLYWLVRRS